ncbi:MAG TPA: 7TM diverse intracellular signaling domain-containing protein, partial [Chitinophagaceae bacterium]
MEKIKLFRYTVILTAIILYAANSAAQTVPQQEDSLWSSYTDISRIGMAKSIIKTVSSAYIYKNENPETSYPSLNFTHGLQHKGTIPSGFVTKKALLKFNICNNADTAVSVYFFPGLYFRDIRLYKTDSSGIQEMPAILPGIPDSIGYRLLSLPAHDSLSILAELTFIKTYIITIRPRLVHPQYLQSFIAELRSTHNQDNLVTYVFCGLLLMMILFSITNFFQGANNEFLYYSGYAFFLGSMLLTKALYDYHTNRINFFFEGYFDFILQELGIMFYMIFMQRFLDTLNKHRFLHQLYNAGVALLLLSMFTYTWFHYFTNNFTAENLVENITKVLLLVMVLIFLIYSARNWKDKLMRYLFWGNLFLFIFSLISQVTIMLDN